LKSHSAFKKDAYEAAKHLIEIGLGNVWLAFDYKLSEITNQGEKAVGMTPFILPAEKIVEGVDSGELPLGD
jgi:dihydroxyacetone kinase-like predicted kinase